jgi:hypothetical protein
MEKKYFSLGPVENNLIIKLIRIIFGLVCAGVAIYWLKFNFSELHTDWTLWITIIFLLGFGFYQIWAGLGRATRFIEIDKDAIRLKKNSVIPPVLMSAGEIEKIEIFPLSVIFFLKSNKRILLRFGTTYYDQNEIILDEIIAFADSNSITFEVIEEKI